MTLRDFTTWLTTTFPNATWRLSFNGSVHHVPAHRQTWFTGEREEIPVLNDHEISYRLTFQREYMKKGEREATYEAPSLEALQAVLVAHYHASVEQVCRELEDL